ncbi:MAG: DNRLRE domain-containing protein [Spirochaetes bacterium]|nr:DNRLRE domain-containing protein [Spirochaetota bacterium]
MHPIVYRRTAPVSGRAIRKLMHAAVLLVSLAALLLSAGEQTAENFRESLAQFGTIKTFDPVPLSAPEIGNPMRGLYGWGGNGTGMMVEAPMFDAYRRFEWSALEDGDTPGTYNFSAIDDAMRIASNAGACFGFRVRAYVPGTKTKCAVPAYLKERIRGFTDQAGLYVPDWNDPYFIERVDAFIAALGARYNKHPHIAFVDIGIYGAWGEWHMSGVPYPGPHGEQKISAANAARIIDIYAKYFPDTWLVFRAGNEHTQYAMETYPRMGCRSDAVANPGFDAERSATPWMADRWKRAPFITETWDTHNPLTSVDLAAGHVTKFHIAMLGNGNMNARITNDAQRAEFQRAGKLCGYRIELAAVGIPSPLTPGKLTSMVSKWRNAGVTPSYIPWTVTWQLRTPDNAVAAAWRSAYDLTKAMPSRSGSLSIEDRFILPASLPAGTYTLALIIEDPAQVRKPMTLAITEEKNADGSYRIATVTVERSASENVTADDRTAVEKNFAALAALQESLVVSYRDPSVFDLSEGTGPGIFECAAEANAFIRGGKNGDTAYGAAPVFLIKKGGGDYERQMVICFDFSSLPADVKSVSGAKVKLYATRMGQDNGVADTAVVIGNDWAEKTVTYNSVPGTSTDITGRWEPTKQSPAAVIDVTAAVNRILESGGERRLSLRISGETPAKNSFGEIEYAGRSHADPGITPRLIIRTK